MTFGYGEIINGSVYLLADSRISIGDAPRGDAQYTPYFRGVIKVIQLTRTCCLTYATQSLTHVDHVLNDYRTRILPQITRRLPVSRIIVEDAEFRRMTLAYFENEHLKAPGTTDFLIAFSSPELSLHRLRNGMRVQVQRGWIGTPRAANTFLHGDKAEDEKQGDSYYSMESSIGFASGEDPMYFEPPSTGLRDAWNPGYFSDLLHRMQRICDSDTHESVGGFASLVFASGGYFYYFPYTRFFRGAHTRLDSWAYSFVPVLNDPSKVVLFLGVAGGSDKRHVVLFGPRKNTNVLGGYTTSGGVTTAVASAGTPASRLAIEYALLSAWQAVVDLPDTHMDDNGTLVVGRRVPSALTVFVRETISASVDLLNRMSVASVLEWPQVKEYRSAIWKLKKCVQIAPHRRHKCLSLMARLASERARLSTGTSSKRHLLICRELARQALLYDGRDLHSRMLAAIATVVLAREPSLRGRFDGELARALEDVAFCCSKGCLTTHVSDVWTMELEYGLHNESADERYVRYADLAIRTFSKQPRTMHIPHDVRLWNRTRLEVRRAERLGRFKSKGSAFRLLVRLSEFWMMNPDHPQVNFYLARSLHLCGLLLDQARKVRQLVSSIPYYSRALKFSPKNPEYQYCMIECLIGLHRFSKTDKIEISARQIDTLLEAFKRDSGDERVHADVQSRWDVAKKARADRR